MELPNGIRRVRIERAHLAVKLEAMHFPLDLENLAEVFRERNYRLVGLPQSRVPQMPSGIRLAVTGQLAESQDGACMVSVFPDRGIVALDGKEVARVLEEFGSIETAIKADLVPDWDERVGFYEIILDASVVVAPDRNPIEEFGGLAGSKLLTDLSDVVQFSATLFGLRLVQKGQLPGENRWIEIKVEPAVSRPRTDYLVNIVRRDRDRGSVLDSADDLLGKALDVISYLSHPR